MLAIEKKTSWGTGSCSQPISTGDPRKRVESFKYEIPIKLIVEFG